MATATYFFNASQNGPTDPNGVWSNDANAFDGNAGTSASTGSSGNASINYLAGGGTTAPTSGGTVTSVSAQATGDAPDGGGVSANVYLSDQTTLLDTASMPGGVPVVLTVPSGGWTFQKVHDLYTRIFGSGGDLYTTARVQVVVTYTPDATDGFTVVLV